MLLLSYNLGLLGMFAREGSKEYVMSQNNRTDTRLPLQKECTLGNQSSWVETQTIDISENGIRVTTDRTLPFKKGCELTVLMPSLDNLPQAKLVWIKKDFNNTTRLGLKFQLPFPDIKHKYFTI